MREVALEIGSRPDQTVTAVTFDRRTADDDLFTLAEARLSPRYRRVILPHTSVALAFQMRAVPKTCLADRVRSLTDEELAELELATDEALGRVEPQG